MIMKRLGLFLLVVKFNTLEPWYQLLLVFYLRMILLELILVCENLLILCVENLISELWYDSLLLIIYARLVLCLLSYQEVRGIFLHLLIIILRVTLLSLNISICLSMSWLILTRHIQYRRGLMCGELIEILMRILWLLNCHLIISLLLNHVKFLWRLILVVRRLEIASLEIIS